MVWDPTSIHRAFSPDYLIPIADRIWRVQRRVSRHIQPHEGDDNWVAGCTAYQRRKHSLTLMANEEPYREWLWAGYLDNQFCIRIHGFPIRIYRSPEEGGIPDRYKVGSPNELSLLSALPGAKSLDFIYRIEVLAKKYGRPIDIFVVQLDVFSGEIANSASIPRSRDVDAPVAKSDSRFRPLRRKPPVMPKKPEVGPNEEKKRPDSDEKEKPA